MRKAKLVATVLLMAGCAKQPEVNGQDTILKDVTVSGGQTAYSVVYGSPSSVDCGSIDERVAEVRAAPSVDEPESDLASRDVRGRLSTYRAYFVPSQLVSANQAAFVFCNGESAALIPAQCLLLGTTMRGCFLTGFYVIPDARSIEATVEAVHGNWPESIGE